MKTNYFSSIFWGMMLLTISLSHSQNILIDGEFNSTTAIDTYFDQPVPDNIWYAWMNDGISNNVTVYEGICNFEITNLGFAQNTWDIQLGQKGFPLIMGHAYQLSFDVKADEFRPFGLFLGEDGGSWTSLIGYNNYPQYAAPYWETKQIYFEATSVFDKHKLSFELGEININMSFDNVILQDLGLPSVGIIGTSTLLHSWDEDVDMVTSDGIHYLLENYPLSEGEAKFRQDNTWNINWGNDTFPTGIGYQDGPNIPIPYAGIYNITFNRQTGEYIFECISNCPANIGIIGTAVSPYFNWEMDVNMATNDGINYKLYSHTFSDGEARFRQDDNWDINWGDDDFPNGTGTQDGPNINVSAGTYNVSFNIVTGDYSFMFPEIGIIGTSLIGWDEDIDMQTTDGILYTLNEYYFTNGEVKFRQDNSWVINWGGDDFPIGWAYLNYYNNIPVQEGTYNVTFNIETGEYNFTATNCPVAGIQCFGGYGYSEPGMCGAIVYYEEPKPAPNCGGEGIVIEQTSGLPSGSFFPTGYTTNTFLLTNAEGQTAECSSTVFVDGDYEPPVVTGITDELSPLWPPNHKMVPIHLDYTTLDNCDQNSISEIFYIYSNEPDNGLGDGDIPNDWEIIDNHNILLRAERSGTGTGRVYFIGILSHDNSNNFSFKEIIVRVPHDNRNPEVSEYSENIIKEKIDSNFENESFKIMTWPNPSSKNFNIQVESFSDESINIVIVNIAGRIISKFSVKNRDLFSFGDDFQSGIYFVIVKQGKYFKTIQLIKE